jgi:hypothetical protein
LPQRGATSVAPESRHRVNGGVNIISNMPSGCHFAPFLQSVNPYLQSVDSVITIPVVVLISLSDLSEIKWKKTDSKNVHSINYKIKSEQP